MFRSLLADTTRPTPPTGTLVKEPAEIYLQVKDFSLFGLEINEEVLFLFQGESHAPGPGSFFALAARKPRAQPQSSPHLCEVGCFCLFPGPFGSEAGLSSRGWGCGEESPQGGGGGAKLMEPLSPTLSSALRLHSV